MVHPHRDARRGRAQQLAQAPAPVAHRRARASRTRVRAGWCASSSRYVWCSCATSDVPLSECERRARRRVPGTPPTAASPGMRPLGQLTLAHDLQALAARDADAADEQQRAAAEGDQDAVVDAVAVSDGARSSRRRFEIGCGLTGHVGGPGAGRTTLVPSTWSGARMSCDDAGARARHRRPGRARGCPASRGAGAAAVGRRAGERRGRRDRGGGDARDDQPVELADWNIAPPGR